MNYPWKKLKKNVLTEEELIIQRMNEEKISYEEAKRRNAIDKFQAYLESLPPMAIID